MDLARTLCDSLAMTATTLSRVWGSSVLIASRSAGVSLYAAERFGGGRLISASAALRIRAGRISSALRCALVSLMTGFASAGFALAGFALASLMVGFGFVLLVGRLVARCLSVGALRDGREALVGCLRIGLVLERDLALRSTRNCLRLVAAVFFAALLFKRAPVHGGKREECAPEELAGGSQAENACTTRRNERYS